MGRATTKKITISLPGELVDFADRLAVEMETNRSRVFADLLAKEERARTEALMAEGYAELGEENLRQAEEALNLTRDVVLNDD